MFLNIDNIDKTGISSSSKFDELLDSERSERCESNKFYKRGYDPLLSPDIYGKLQSSYRRKQKL